jgi:hypothetical protein
MSFDQPEDSESEEIRTTDLTGGQKQDNPATIEPSAVRSETKQGMPKGENTKERVTHVRILGAYMYILSSVTDAVTRPSRRAPRDRVRPRLTPEWHLEQQSVITGTREYGYTKLCVDVDVTTLASRRVRTRRTTH